MPVESENWKDIMKDFERFIMPGVTHWQSPRFHAYYPSQTSFPSIIGEMLSAGLGVVGFSWVSLTKKCDFKVQRDLQLLAFIHRYAAQHALNLKSLSWIGLENS